MTDLFLLERKIFLKNWMSYMTIFLILFFGFIVGSKFNLNVGKGLYMNSAFNIGYLQGLLSLGLIFLSSFFAIKALFKDWDSGFDTILYTLPISKKNYLGDRFIFLFFNSFGSFVILMVGFAIGQSLRTEITINPHFNILHYLYPLLIFGFQNSLFICCILFFISYATRNKLIVVVAGLMLYVCYMVIMIYANSPFMSGSTPQSLELEKIAALIDPFGLSAYFTEAKKLSVTEKNYQIIPLEGYLLANRILYLTISAILLFLTFKVFNFTSIPKIKRPKPNIFNSNSSPKLDDFLPAELNFEDNQALRSIKSFVKIDLIYISKGIAWISVCMLILFFVGMEMYAEIEKGIRLPQKYASSGLMAESIIENFQFIGMLFVVYFSNDLFWRSHASKFFMIEKTCFYSKFKTLSHFFSISILLIIISLLLIVQGILFQISYDYPYFDWKAYSGIFLFNTIPLILFSAFILLLNSLVKNRYIALGLSILALISWSGPLSKKIFPNPIFQFFSSYQGVYSDFNGFGYYPESFTLRLIFGMSIIGILWLIYQFVISRKLEIFKVGISLLLLTSAIISGIKYLKSYVPKNENLEIINAANYEKQYKSKYKELPQPTITNLKTEINLFPESHRYDIKGEYTLENKSAKPISAILVNFSNQHKIEKAIWISKNEIINLKKNQTEIKLKKPLLPGESAKFNFLLEYKSYAINGHESFNSIIENGSFLRISRYYPIFGYQKDMELENEQIRKQLNLPTRDKIKSPDAPAVHTEDFLNLDMQISTSANQTAIGTGDLINSWKQKNRNFYTYKANQIPFRFAVSSANYQIKSFVHRGIKILIYFHPKHFQNVANIMASTVSSLDYCIDNFGPYPFKSIQLAEISSFTKGFAGTAYPANIFMPENMIFHANLTKNNEQDVINEITAHELSHLWWGNSQIDPDNREGQTMLTESLAMYTEMMIYKKQYGEDLMKKRLQIHKQIFESEKGYAENQPLFKVHNENTHISYSLGAMAMVKLSEILTEKKVNLALSNFLKNNNYPKKPSSLDLIEEFLKVSPNRETDDKIINLLMAPW